MSRLAALKGLLRIAEALLRPHPLEKDAAGSPLPQLLALFIHGDGIDSIAALGAAILHENLRSYPWQGLPFPRSSFRVSRD